MTDTWWGCAPCEVAWFGMVRRCWACDQSGQRGGPPALSSQAAIIVRRVDLSGVR